jgi:hypothetical protein
VKDIMRSVTVKNETILGILNEFKDLWWSKKDTDLKKYHLGSSDTNREDYITEEYKNKIMVMGGLHNGFPEKLKGYSLKAESINGINKYDSTISERFTILNEKLQQELGTQHNALSTVYPPGGFISWHNNANASSYNLIFTWSENGDGYWKHVDPYTGNEVLVKDVPGWQCKAFYFGSYEDNHEDLVYHMASTDCWRMTISYIFDRYHKEYWEDVIEELETE